ncbi:MAG TPA: NTP transferase domain-containing protein [Bacteroidales bacterium]|nr:NTP transferase domain-containing protein [Bacteroidales bacterium]
MSPEAVVILAAGLSERMGRDKLSLEFGNGNTFLSQILIDYHALGHCQCVVVVNPIGQSRALEIIETAKVPATVVINTSPEAGRFLSLQLGLQALKSADSVFVHNIDNPFVDPALLEKLLKNRPLGDFVVPVYESKGGHPVLLNSYVVQSILMHPDPRTPLNDFLKKFRKATVATADRRILTNINTPDDFREFLAQHQARS